MQTLKLQTVALIKTHSPTGNSFGRVRYRSISITFFYSLYFSDCVQPSEQTHTHTISADSWIRTADHTTEDGPDWSTSTSSLSHQSIIISPHQEAVSSYIWTRTCRNVTHAHRTPSGDPRRLVFPSAALVSGFVGHLHLWPAHKKLNYVFFFNLSSWKWLCVHVYFCLRSVQSE